MNIMVAKLWNLIPWVEVYFSVDSPEDEFGECRRLNFKRERC